MGAGGLLGGTGEEASHPAGILLDADPCPAPGLPMCDCGDTLFDSFWTGVLDVSTHIAREQGGGGGSSRLDRLSPRRRRHRGRVPPPVARLGACGMSHIEALLRNYERFVRLPWERGLAGPQRVWFLIYDRTQGAPVAAANRGSAADNGQRRPDLAVASIPTDSFGRWMATQEYRDAYFEEPEYLADKMPEFLAAVAREVEAQLHRAVRGRQHSGCRARSRRPLRPDPGVGAERDRRAPYIRGRLLVFFPWLQRPRKLPAARCPRRLELSGRADHR